MPKRFLLRFCLTEPCFMDIPEPGNKTNNSRFKTVKQVKKVDSTLRSFVMIRNLSTFAIMACLASSLAFAGDKAKPKSSVADAKTETTQTAAPDNVQQDGSSPCASACSIIFLAIRSLMLPEGLTPSIFAKICTPERGLKLLSVAFV